MKHFATLAAFAASANALVGRTDSCCFKLTASGGASGSLGQLDDGQNRVGDNSLPPATYCIDSTGSITDSNGRGCILTPPTTQLQCDQGASPTPGFSISSGGELQYQGSSSFVACETGMNGGMNIYTTNSSSTTGCIGVTLTADSCSGSGAGAGPSGAPSSGAGASSSGVPVISPSGGASSVGPSGHASSGVPSGPSGAPGVGPSGHASSVPGVSSSVVSVATPESSAPVSSGPVGPGAPGVAKTTVHTTMTVTSCPASSTAPVGPGASVGPSGTPSGPGAGVGSSGSPSGPGAGVGPSGTPSGPGGGVSPSGTPSSSVPGGGVSPSGHSSVPGGGVSPSGTPSGGVSPSGPGGGVGPSATPSGAQPSGTGSGGASCPTDLSGNYEYPHLIIPVDSSAPNKASGTSFNGTITNTVSSIFNFDVPNSDSGKTCSLVFLFPHLKDLETSSYSFSGNGKIDFAQLDSPAKGSTNYNNRPHVKQDFGDFTVSPGNSYLISTFKCPAGQTVAYEMKNAGSTNLDFFEDYNPSPLGLYITVC